MSRKDNQENQELMGKSGCKWPPDKNPQTRTFKNGGNFMQFESQYLQ